MWLTYHDDVYKKIIVIHFSFWLLIWNKQKIQSSYWDIKEVGMEASGKAFFTPKKDLKKEILPHEFY